MNDSMMEQLADLQQNFIRLSSRISELEDKEKERNLKPCPFCGSRAELWDDRGVNFWVTCHSCGLSMKSYITRDEAISKWERRV